MAVGSSAVGELLAVALIASRWLLVVSFAVLRHGGLPRSLGITGVPVAVVVLSPATELVGSTPLGVSVGTSALHGWLRAVGTTVALGAWRKRRPTA